MDQQIRTLAEKIWNYHLLHHELTVTDAILVLCSHDEVVAERGAQLFLDGWAPILIFSGGAGAITKTLWTEPEAERFARIALKMGVPQAQILIENRSTNTGENVRFTRQLLKDRGLDPQKFMVVQKPYMERRSYATFRKEWPEKDLIVTSPQTSFADYLAHYEQHDGLTQDDMVSIMVGDLQRIKVYPSRGYQIEQDIPAEVWAAYEELVRAGYDRHLVE